MYNDTTIQAVEIHKKMKYEEPHAGIKLETCGVLLYSRKRQGMGAFPTV